MATRVAVERIMDANVNRAKEGLRVCEEICRFLLKSPALTRGFKSARHAIDAIVRTLAGSGTFIRERDSRADPGRPADTLESVRQDVASVFYANVQRAKEAVRVLEEFSKLSSSRPAARFKQLRFSIYELEKKAVSRLRALP